MDFATADAWPGLTRGPALFDAVRGINLPIAGFIDAAQSDGMELAPLSWCSAQPSGPVTEEAYERIAALLLEDLRASAPFDAVYLDLHGAMVAEHLDDADGELLRRVRELVGPALPVIASLDFHANLSDLSLASASTLVSYRTYPHVDMAATGARAARLLPRLVRQPIPLRNKRALDFLIPLAFQSTLVEPTLALMAHAAELEQGSLLSVGFTPGFPLADVAHAGPVVYAFGQDTGTDGGRDVVAHAVNELARAVADSESAFAGRHWSIDDAIARTSQCLATDPRTVILADTQDNPGAGGNADTMALIKASIAAGWPHIIAGVICDPAAALAAHAAGVGHHVQLELGAGSAFPGDSPLRAEFTIDSLGSGRFEATGPFYLGSRMDLGPMACLRLGDCRIVVASRKQQAADGAMFRHVGVEPMSARVLVLKSSVHFRADFGGFAGEILIVAAPGPSSADPADLPFRKLRPGVRRRLRS